MDGLMLWLRKLIVIAPQTKICNDADGPILLIPYVALNGTTHKNCKFKHELAIEIKPRESEEVDSARYNYRKFDSQIYFLLRAGKREDLENYENGVTLAQGEKCYVYEHLSNKREVHLSFAKDGKVIGLADDAGQTSNVNEQTAAGTQTPSQAEYLEGIAEILKWVAESLQERAKARGSGLGQ